MKAYITDRFGTRNGQNVREVCIVLAKNDAEAITIVEGKFGQTKTGWSEWGITSSTDVSSSKWIFHAFD